MSQPPVPVVHINIHNMDFQANTVLSSGRGGRVIQRNSMYHRSPVVSNAPHCTPLNYSSSAASRRVEAQPWIRQKLEEVTIHPEYASSRIGLVALSATGILAVVEENLSFNTQLVDLAMDAHAVAYIVVVSFIYRRLRMSKKRVDKLIELLDMIYALLVEAAATGNIVVFLKRLATRNQRKIRATRTREELLNLLKKIERNNNVDVLSCLNAALDYHHQHSEVNAAE